MLLLSLVQIHISYMVISFNVDTFAFPLPLLMFLLEVLLFELSSSYYCSVWLFLGDGSEAIVIILAEQSVWMTSFLLSKFSLSDSSSKVQYQNDILNFIDMIIKLITINNFSAMLLFKINICLVWHLSMFVDDDCLALEPPPPPDSSCVTPESLVWHTSVYWNITCIFWELWVHHQSLLLYVMVIGREINVQK